MRSVESAAWVRICSGPAPGRTAEAMWLAAVWASRGYVVVMPDYIGSGDDTSEPHPYVVYPNVNAESGLAMVKAARSLLSGSYKVTASLPLFITAIRKAEPMRSRRPT